ncbi:hypothetical protein H6A04_11875, partial [Fusobacterium mortiferum]|nr:hypothetical protein [Fusobacterium mortiferum]
MKKIIIFLLISSLLLAKDINVGDLVRVHISGVEKDKIINEFKNSDLQLENLEKTDEGYILSIRGYKPGDSSITLGDKKLTLSITNPCFFPFFKGIIFSISSLKKIAPTLSLFFIALK